MFFQGKHGRAIQLYEKLAMSEIFDVPQLWMSRGDAYFQIQNYEKACEDYEKLLEVSTRYNAGSKLTEVHTTIHSVSFSFLLYSCVVYRWIKPIKN
mgnify:FL=1